MKRDLFALESSEYDVLVVGGGIHGAFVAWDASQRGLKVALAERGDFGSATSANSLKTVHGGLRYLQDFDLRLVQKMIFERKSYLKIAPHLVHTLPFVVPTIQKFTRSYSAMGVALKLNDLIGHGRNKNQPIGKEISPSRLISKEECLAYLPGLDPKNVTGGALWYDAQIFNTERFVISVLKAAHNAGACLANYLSVKQILINDGKVVAAKVKDEIADGTFEIRAKTVINATGAWIDQLIVDSNHQVPSEIKYPLTVAWNLVTRKFINDCAAGIFTKSQVDGKSKLLFVAPWRNYSITGTVHEAIDGEPDDYQIPESQISEFLKDINYNYRGANLTLNDVQSVHKGFHHVKSVSSKSKRDTKALRKGIVFDHGQKDSIEGLITLVSVKFTTARAVAEQAVDLVCQKAGIDRRCETHFRPIFGGEIVDFNEFMTNSLNDQRALIEKSFLYNYGTAYRDVLRELDLANSDELEPVDIFYAQIKYAIKEEMALRISDALLRRTDVGSGEAPSVSQVTDCANIMQKELGWSDQEKVDQINLFQDQIMARWSFASKSTFHPQKETLEQK